MKVYSMLLPNTPAIAKMDEYLHGSPSADHLKMAETEQVETQITDILPQSADTWEIDWVETVRDRNGTVKEPPYKMRAIVTVATVIPDLSTSEDQIRANPLGLYVKNFSWSKQF